VRLNCGLFDLPAVKFPVSPFAACAEATAKQACAEWIDGVIPAACQASGALAAGATCAAGFQCATELCDLAANGCGKCVQPPGLNQMCFRGFCANGLVCNPLKVCVAPRVDGAACDDNNPCLSSIGCHDGLCAPLGGPGGPCATNDQCDIYNGVVCNKSQGACVSVTLGPMCTQKPDGSFVFCGGSATCQQTDGSCLPAAADGAACSVASGPDCLWPAVCSTDNRCHLFQANRTCGGSAAQGRADPRRALEPAAGGWGALWRSMLPRRPDGF
jgi:hypothetical protein